MILARHIVRLLGETITMALVTRRISLLVAILVGLVLAAVVVTVQVAAPLVVYPFA